MFQVIPWPLFSFPGVGIAQGCEMVMIPLSQESIVMTKEAVVGSGQSGLQ